MMKSVQQQHISAQYMQDDSMKFVCDALSRNAIICKYETDETTCDYSKLCFEYAPNLYICHNGDVDSVSLY
ncbi:hypothetical protein [Candidatus Cyrtobacter comes]|nr:hypothetical protein [Candidatus Cyrtobacter comes]